MPKVWWNYSPTEYFEAHCLLPSFQFGFRKGKNTTGAVALLNEIVRRRLQNKERTYVAFIDFKKAFDTVDRCKLLTKLQILGLPVNLCSLLHFIFKNMKIYLRSGDMFTKALKSTTGVLQGDVLSPTLFNLFTSDLPDQMSHSGVDLDNLKIKYIMYADDLCLIAHDANDLQIALNNLEKYCDKNNLTVNITKSKLVIFHKGRLPKCEIYYKQTALERVNEFTYLGITLSSQLTYSSHLQSVITKADTRIGLLYSKLELQNMPIEVVMYVFA